MASSGIKDAIESQQVRGISKIDPVSIPGFGPSTISEGLDLMKYKVRYSKIDLDDMGSIAELEILETRAIRNQGIFILSKERFTFLEKMYIVVGYLEEEIVG